MRCRLCGHGFDPQALACHSECPMGSRCSLICCPACGYQVVDESRSLVARALRRVWPERSASERRRSHRAPGVPLTHVPVGAGAEILALEGMPPSRLARLVAFGVAPGTTVEVLQARPVPVVRIGETELAISQEILGQIRVRPREEASAG